MSNEANAPRKLSDRPPSIPPPDPLIGRTLDGRYRIEAVLGEGGMGLVYRARHAMLNKPLAIKVLRPEVSRDQEVMSRFQQEAQSASGIGNQHIIDISDFGSLPDGSTYFVMEFLDGKPLTKAIEAQTPMPPRRVAHIAKQLCEALGAAHEQSIVHRDMKPDNIYLIKRGQDPDFVKVLDFGIAKVGGASSKLTKAGQVFGTPHYMSPEQCAGTHVDHRTDIYALGVILYEMASGRVPFDADNLMGILTKHMYEQPIAPSQLPQPLEVTPGLEAIILKCLAKAADARYQTMGELHADLTLLEQGATPAAVNDQAQRPAAASTQRRDGTGRIPLQSMMRIGEGDPGESAGSKSRAPVLIGLFAVAVAAAGAVGAFVYFGQTRPTPVVSVAAPPSPTPTEVPEPPIGANVEPPAIPSSPSRVEGDPAPTRVALSPTIRVTSDPDGAEVWRGDALLGNTPFELPRPEEGESLEISLRKSGYQSQSVGLSSITAGQVRLELVAERRPSGRRPPRTAPAAASPAPHQAATPAPATHHSGQSEVLDPWR